MVRVLKNRNHFIKTKEAFSVKQKLFSFNYYFSSHKTLKNPYKMSLKLLIWTQFLTSFLILISFFLPLSICLKVTEIIVIGQYDYILQLGSSHYNEKQQEVNCEGEFQTTL